MRYAIWNEFVATEVEQIHRPREAEEVATLIRLARERGRRIKAVGAGHSFNDLSLTDELLVDLRQLDRLVAVDREKRLVRVQGGMPLYVLIVALDRLGLALPNIGAWTEQTVAGVLSTATHGSGGRWRKSLVEAAVEITLVDGRGELRVLRGEDLKFTTLGYFGVITEVVLRCEPLFHVRQSNMVQDGERAICEWDEQLAAHDFVDLRWVGSLPRAIVRRWDMVDEGPSLRDRAARRYEGVKLNALNRFLSLLRSSELSRAAHDRLYGELARAYIAQGRGFDNTAVWHEGLTFNSLGVAAPHEEREFALPLERSRDCLLALRALMLGRAAAASLEIQIRFSPAVDLLLAPNQGRDTVWFNLNVMSPGHSAELVERVSRAAAEFDARPHWGKVIPAGTRSAAALYGAQSAARWEAQRHGFDPDGLFLNAFYARHLAPQAIVAGAPSHPTRRAA